MADKKETPRRIWTPEQIQAVLDTNDVIREWNIQIRKRMGCEETQVDWDEFEAKVLNGPSEPEKEKKRPSKQFSIAEMEVENE